MYLAVLHRALRYFHGKAVSMMTACFLQHDNIRKTKKLLELRNKLMEVNFGTF
jgi:hypothetical protein